MMETWGPSQCGAQKSLAGLTPRVSGTHCPAGLVRVPSTHLAHNAVSLAGKSPQRLCVSDLE